MLRFLAYLMGSIVVTTVVHAYLHRRMIRDAALPERFHRHARVGFIGVAALLPAGMIGLLTMHDTPRSVQAPVMWCAFVWVGLLLFLLPLVLVGEAFRTSPTRRRFIALVSGIATLAFGGASAVVAHLPLAVRRVRVPLRGLGTAKHGYKIVQISDVHVSATIGRGLVDALVASVNALDADLIAVTGDLVDGSVRELGPLVAPLANLRARDGVFFVTGNHEYLSGVDEWVAFASSSLGFRVLRNERVAIGGADGFDLVGIDDQAGTPDLAAALHGRDESRASILLAHRPDDVADAAKRGIGLQISGHTHGGQISPIGWALERVRQPYVFGLYEVEKTWLYVTSGAGYWGPPMRLATRAEIAVFELVTSVTSSASAGAASSAPNPRGARARRR